MTITHDEVRREIVVAGSPDRAFRLFTERIAEWWPADHHLAGTDVVGMRVESEVGGGIVDLYADGSECVWGRVTAWNPPTGFGFAWMIDGTWQIETDVERASRVTVEFLATPEGTRITLVHNEFDRMVDGAAGMSSAVGGDGGWPQGLSRFAEFAARA